MSASATRSRPTAQHNHDSAVQSAWAVASNAGTPAPSATISSSMSMVSGTGSPASVICGGGPSGSGSHSIVSHRNGTGPSGSSDDRSGGDHAGSTPGLP